MHLSRLLQINIATLTSLGALLFGMGQRDQSLPVLMLLAAVASLILTDFTGWFRLNRTVANVAVLVVAAISARELLQDQGDIRILGIGNLLVYMQVILLFQEKDLRTYRHLIMLSLLQVVVAAVLSQGVGFGVLLAVYMLLGFSALMLMLLDEQCTRYEVARLPARKTASSPQRRWPLAKAATQFTGASTARIRRTAGRELFFRLIRFGSATLALTALMFLAVPRFGQSAWQGVARRTQQVVGFSDKVALGEMGRIIESRERVMKVRLVDDATGQPYTVAAPIYLRGAVLNHYERGEWEHRRPRPMPKLAVATQPDMVRQQITIEPLDRDELFSIWPPVTLRTSNRVQLDPAEERLRRSPRRRVQRFTYELGTTGLVDGRQVELNPSASLPSLQHLPLLLQVPEGPLRETLKQHWRDEPWPTADDPVKLARAMVAKFHDSELFQYSLDPQQRTSDVDLEVDPIADFLTSNPRGHCEYFATALTLLMRSRGVPARMVVGYTCDEYDESDHTYQVRQWHAHAWVEVYLTPQQALEQAAANDSRRWDNGGWLRLDPTPGSGGPQLGDDAAMLGQIRNRWHSIQDAWNDYVVDMDRHRQQQAIYGPIARGVRHAIDCLSDPDWWRNLGRVFDVTQWRLGWLWAGLTLLVVVPMGVFLGRRCWRLMRWAIRGLTGRGGVDRPGMQAQVEFYHRFETLLARRGMVRRMEQTQHEFAVDAGRRMAESAQQPKVAGLPQLVADAFYQVRFGRLPLDSARTAAVEHALEQLAACGRDGAKR